MKTLIPLERIERRIYLIRGTRVMLDRDLAELYEVPTKVLNQAVKRRMNRFPEDFAFRLNKDEIKDLVSRSGISSGELKMGLRKPPHAFTEQGIAMLSSVLNSERAVHVNIEIIRAFVNMRRLLASHRELARRLEELEKKVDVKFAVVFDAIRKTMEYKEKPRKPIGFRPAAEH